MSVWPNENQSGRVMKFYGLHWIADDGTPMQVRIETRTLRCWARSCPRGGEWTAWRRLDVERNSDGTLNETCMNAIHAKVADACNKLARTCSIYLSGAVTGAGILDGSGDVHIVTSLGEGGGDNQGGAIESLEQRVAALEAQSGSGGDAGSRLGKLEMRQANIIAQIRTFRRYIFPDDTDTWDPDNGY